MIEERDHPSDQQHPRVQKGLEVLADAGALERMFVDRSWLRDEAALAKVAQSLTVLAAHYLMREKYGEGARDRVANFHLSNGASIERINFPADVSRRGQKQSAGLMVNYRYRLKDIETNHESYHGKGEIAHSRVIASLLKIRLLD